jgi:integrase
MKEVPTCSTIRHSSLIISPAGRPSRSSKQHSSSDSGAPPPTTQRAEESFPLESSGADSWYLFPLCSRGWGRTECKATFTSAPITTKSGKQTIRWYVVVDVGTDPTGRRRQKWHGGFGTRREAEVARAKLVDDLHTASYVMPDRLTFAEWVRNSWLPMTEARVKPTTFHSYKRNLEIHVIPHVGSRPVQQLTPLMLNAMYAKLQAEGSGHGPLSAKTVRYIHTTIHKALEDAVDAAVIGRNPAARAKPPRPSRRSTRRVGSWEPSELAAFLGFVRGTRLEAAWRLATMTGMRRGEILGLRWADIDLEKARLSVRQAVVAVAYEMIESTPKSHNARVIDLDSETVDLLRAHRRRQQDERAEWGTDYEDRDLVVCHENGSPIHPQSFSQTFARLVKQAAVRVIRLHDLRHTHATLALKAGVPVKVVSERLGHEPPAFTLKQYAHVIPGMQAAAAAVVADLIRREANTEGRVDL